MENPAGLIPENDPSLLFTGAGMNQFKNLFLERGESDLKKAATCQRCLRATDIENVGKTTKHLTFIEMLGSFSFGDYFKKEAISYAWEFMLKVLEIPEEKLLITVYKDDDEAARIWEEMGVREENIFYMGEKDNFWDMGKTGPCGPCSEIVFDRGKEYSCGQSTCDPACDCDRYVEVWNLVFTQFNRREDGKLEPLRQKNIDTGMGLERIASIMQGVRSVFDIDIIQPIILEVQRPTLRAGAPDSETSGGEDIVPARIIADHIRAITFCIADGVLPSNEGRGYVVRKLIRRAVERGMKLGKKKPFLHRLVPVVISGMKNFYPELSGRDGDIALTVKSEEERFFAVFERLPELEDKIREFVKAGEGELPGELCFRYYDTYGIPVETIREVAQSMDMKIDMDGFDKAMEGQRTRGREASTFISPLKELPKAWKTTFTGYEEAETGARVLAIIKEGNELGEARKGESVDVVTDRTPFYGEAGGQAGDEGEITGERWKFKVTNTIRFGETIVHRGVVEEGILKKEGKVKLSVNGERRSHVAANHTATHLLHYGLREILGKHVRQSGSFVGPDRLRFDFTHASAISREELSRIEELVNELIVGNYPIEISDLPLEEAKKVGAIALFGEKYGEIVRVVKIDDYSLEFCGGTHLRSTGEIGIFLIESESSIAAGVRRIEAVSGRKAYSQIRRGRLILSGLAETLRTLPGDLPERVSKLVEKVHALEKKAETLQMGKVISEVGEFVARAEAVDGIKVVADIQKSLSKDGLRKLTDVLKVKLGSGIAVLGTVADGKVLLCAGVTDDLVKQGLHAGKLLKEAASIVEGSGGGRADFAQAGGKNVGRLKDAIKAIPEIVRKQING